MLTTIVTALCVSVVAVPSANADINGTESTTSAVTSSRSFPSVVSAREDLFAEHASTAVEENTDWGGVENLDVPQTKSQAERDQEAAEAAAAQARAKAEQEQAQALAQAQSQAASRSQQRASVQQRYTVDDSSVSGSAGSMVNAAYALIGQHMDCTALVSAALAAAGINFHGYPEEYASVGQQVTDGTLKPGDILIYRYTGGWNGGAHWDHVALYVGGGKAIHGGWNGSTVAIAGTLNPDMVVRVF